VFARLGFARARMDDIAQEAGLSKGTLYLYFRSKEALIQALLDRLFRREAEGLRQALEGHTQPVPQRLRQLFAGVLARLLSYRPLLPLFYEFYALAARHRSVGEACRPITALTPVCWPNCCAKVWNAAKSALVTPTAWSWRSSPTLRA